VMARVSQIAAEELSGGMRAWGIVGSLACPVRATR
jgi:hypothetical protein